MKDIIGGILVGLAMAICMGCLYVMGFLRAHIKFSEEVLSPWLDWRFTQIRRARDMAPPEALALFDDLKTDMAAYEALTGVVHKTTFPWDRAPKYARSEVTP